MTEIRIFMEGGGKGPGGKAALRRGMDRLLRAVKDEARKSGCRWRLLPCGSRNETWKRFRGAVTADPRQVAVLLVDAEAEVGSDPAHHLQTREGWDLADVPDADVHLMVQIMETWLVADPRALADYYGRDFRSSSLPSHTNLERVRKSRIERSLQNATRATGKGAYHKIKHGSDLLGLVDPEIVRKRCPHCDRFVGRLERLVTREP